MVSDSSRFEMTPFAFTVDNLLMIFNSILQAPLKKKKKRSSVDRFDVLPVHVIPIWKEIRTSSYVKRNSGELIIDVETV